VVRVMAALDNERRAVAAAFGHDLPTVIEEMRAIGTVSAQAAADDYRAAISDGEANRRIRAPDTLAHRYYAEDFGYGLTPFLAFASIANVQTPVAAALSLLGDAASGARGDAGRTAERMGIAGLSCEALLRRVRGTN
jgi:opine dehydrogenase